MLKHIMATGLLLTAGQALAVEPLVPAEWLNDNLENDDLVVLDIRYNGVDREAFAAGHIPGSIYDSYRNGWRVEQGGVPGMLPEVAQLENKLGGLGIERDDTVVVVSTGDSSSDFGAAARIYWTLKVLGHEDVAILNGGYTGWEQQGFPVSSEPTDVTESEYRADYQPQLVATADEVANAGDDGFQLVDSRSEEYFAGRAKAGPARVAGTIPDSLLLDNGTLVEGDADGAAYFITRERLESLLEEASVNYESTGTITFCNTGHLAATDWFALSEIAELDNVAMYDGSLAEWTSDPDRPVQTQARGLGRLFNFF